MRKAKQKIGGPHISSELDKYNLYSKSVQSPDVDVVFFRKVYRELRRKTPKTLREDFCGTFSICCEWVKLGKQNEAYGVDLDPEPLNYGRRRYLTQLTRAEQERVHICELDVLTPHLPSSDLIVVLNFSFFIFKERSRLKAYFQNCRETLKEEGLLILDLFGGSLCHSENEESRRKRGFTYYWHQKSFDPVTHFADFSIHFKVDRQKKIEDVFTYSWRMWGIAEVRELLTEVGFSRTHVYWEGTTSRGTGDGEFKRTTVGEECESWIAYVVAEK